MADHKRRRITQRSGSPLSRGCTEMWGNQAADTRREYSLGTGMPKPPLTLSPDRSLRSRRLKPSPNGRGAAMAFTPADATRLNPLSFPVSRTDPFGARFSAL